MNAWLVPGKPLARPAAQVSHDVPPAALTLAFSTCAPSTPGAPTRPTGMVLSNGERASRPSTASSRAAPIDVLSKEVEEMELAAENAAATSSQVSHRELNATFVLHSFLTLCVVVFYRPGQPSRSHLVCPLLPPALPHLRFLNLRCRNLPRHLRQCPYQRRCRLQ